MPKISGKMDDSERAICARVKEFREMIKWPQPGFAKELGISKDQLASIEYKRTPLRYATGFRLCYMFDVNQEWLANGRGSVTPFTDRSGPVPSSLPDKILFSEVYSEALKFSSKLASDVQRTGLKGDSSGGPETRYEADPNFDLTSWLLGKILETVKREKIVDPLEKKEFAYTLSHLMTTVVLNMRRRRTRKIIRKGGVFVKQLHDETTDLTYNSVDIAKQILAKREKIRHLEADIMMLEEDDWVNKMRQIEKVSEGKKR